VTKKKQKDTTKKPWVCKHGCKVTKVPCPHLEALLPAESRQSIYGTPSDQIELSQIIDTTNNLDNQAFEFRAKLAKLGLMDEAITILVDKFVDDKSFEEIAKTRSFLGLKALKRFYNITLDDIRRKIKNEL
jgi:hypothetical protein